MDNYQIKKRFDEIIHMGGYDKTAKEKDEGCQFLSKNNERFCKATTNKTCKGCKFFTPTMSEAIRKVTEYTLRQDRVIEEKERQIEEKDRQIRVDKSNIKNMQDTIFRLEFLQCGYLEGE